MTLFAALPDRERAAFTREAAARLDVSPIIVEKDFWVCWLLGVIFAAPALGPHLVFKGGTSLSKVYGIIHRFSEDIDLSVSPALLGWQESELDNAPSQTQRQKRFEKLEAACAAQVEHGFQNVLETQVRIELGNKIGGGGWLTYQIDPLSKSPLLLFNYPSALPPEVSYIQRLVRLEFGALTDQAPTGKHRIAPMLTESIPGICDDGQAEVVALEPERTFWEKATILHAEYHRPATQPIRERYARHYSDMSALWSHPVKSSALARLDLLERVATHKRRFFASSWSSYDSAKPGSLCLRPPRYRDMELARDYEKMKGMFIKTPPPFDDMMKTLEMAEGEINMG
jgi:hypothetical protein